MAKIKEMIGRLYGGEDRLIKVLLTAAVLCWLPRLFTPLWRDEAITWWIISGGWAEALSRALSYQEWSTAYFLLLKAFTGAAHSEPLLRLPSLAAGAVCLRAVYLAGLRLKDGRAGLLAALVLASSAAALNYFNEARPYAPALAFNALALLYLLKAADEGRPRHAAIYAVCAAAGAYMHLTTGLMIAAHGFYLAWRARTPRPAAPIAWAGIAAAGLLTLPQLYTAVSVFGRREGLMFADKPDMFSLLYCILPPDMILGAAAGFLIARRRGAVIVAGRTPEGEASGLALATTLTLTPLLAAFALSVSGTSLWVDRYFICYQLGIALAAGLLLPRLGAALRPAAAAVTLFALASHMHIYHIKEDWAGAMDYARAEAGRRQAGLLLTSPFIESLQPGWLTDSGREAFLSAPLSFYGCPAPLTLLPLPRGADNEAAIAKAVSRASAGGAAVLLSLGDHNYDERLRRRMLAAGFVQVSRRAGRLFPRAYVFVKERQEER